MATSATKSIDTLSPFELKDLFIKEAKESSRKSQATMLNAGRGNPNWIATTPREAFFLLGKFALGEARRSRDEPGVGLAGMPAAAGIGKRLKAFLAANSREPGAALLEGTFDYGVKDLGFDPVCWCCHTASKCAEDNLLRGVWCLSGKLNERGCFFAAYPMGDHHLLKLDVAAEGFQFGGDVLNCFCRLCGSA